MSTRVLGLLWTLAATMVAGRNSLLAQCAPHWDPYSRSEFNGVVGTACVPDSGSSPGRMYIGGSFTFTSDDLANYVASWDGTSWSPLGAGTNGPVGALAWFDDDDSGPHPPALYAGGLFLMAGGVNASHVAKWDGTSWSALGAGISGGVSALAVFDDDGPGPHLPALYAGGDFSMATGGPGDRVAKWDGSSWSAVGSTAQPGYPVADLTVFDDDGAGPHPAALYAGGAFLSLGGGGSNHVAKWDGVSWSSLGTGLNDDVNVLVGYDEDGAGPIAPALYAGGYFDVGGDYGIARWDGTTWSSVGGGLNGRVESFTVFDDDAGGPHAPALFVGGAFSIAGGTTSAHRVVSWNGSSWSALGAGIDGTNAFVSVLAAFDDDGGGPHLPALYAGGGFSAAGGLPATGMAAWDGANWSGTGGSGVDGIDVGNAAQGLGVFSFTVLDDPATPGAPALFAGGLFQTAGSVSASNIARWDGASWSPLGSGTSYDVLSLTVYDDDGPGPLKPAVYAGGFFLSAGGGTVNCVAKWDGQAWSSLGGGVGGLHRGVGALTVFDDDSGGPHTPELIVGGQFTSAGGVSANNIAKWNGTSWSALGSGVDAFVAGLAVFDDDGNGPHPPALYASGSFTTAGGIAANYVAKWDGTSWSPLGAGMNIGVGCLTVFDDDGSGPHPPELYAGGPFTLAGGATAHYIAKWNGSSWSALASEVNQPVDALGVFDEDGVGPNPPVLFAGGEFWTAGGVGALSIAKWNGTSWSPLGAGTNHHVHAFDVYDGDGNGPNPPALMVGGMFSMVDGHSSPGLAGWVGCGPSVAPTCAGDGVTGVCPCGNNGLLRHGCENSAGTGGAILNWTGNPGLASDTFVLTSTGELSSPLSIFLQGDLAIAPTFFGDGLRCVSGSLKRLYTKTAAGGVASAPSGTEPSCSARSAARGDAFAAGAARFYQVYYRDPNPGFCPNPPGNTWNVSSGLAVVWNP